jgi:hypothetical protein
MQNEGITKHVYKTGKLLNLCAALFPLVYQAGIKHLIRCRFPA